MLAMSGFWHVMKIKNDIINTPNAQLDCALTISESPKKVGIAAQIPIP